MKELLDYTKTTHVMDNIFAVSLPDMLILAVLAFGMGMYIGRIYRRIYSGAMYSSTFEVSLIGLSMITTTLILAVTSNLVLSLGMVGALSIVRFRTAIKDPMEIVFLFWSIETGIVLAAGIIPMAVVVNLAIGAVLLLLVKKRPDYPYILVIRCDKSAVKDIENVLIKNTESFTVRSRKASYTDATNGKDIVEMDIEVVLKEGIKKQQIINQTDFVDLLKSKGAEEAILVTYNGEYMS